MVLMFVMMLRVRGMRMKEERCDESGHLVSVKEAFDTMFPDSLLVV